jgi:hypothetical protein
MESHYEISQALPTNAIEMNVTHREPFYLIRKNKK